MDLKQIRQLLGDRTTVVVVEEGQPSLVIRQLADESRSAGAVVAESPQEESAAEVPISSRWPKAPRTIHERTGQDQVLERLNKEILALREHIALEDGTAGQSQDHN